MTSVALKAKRVNLIIGGISMNAYQLDTGEYKLSGRNVTECVKEPVNSLKQLYKVKSLKDLPDYKPESFDVMGKALMPVPIEIALNYWLYCAQHGNNRALKIYQAITSEAATMFNIDWTKINTRLFIEFPKRVKPENIPQNIEQQIADQLAYELHGEREVVTPTGRIDVLTFREVIEVKHCKSWKSAVGQVLIYGMSYPNRAKRIHLFGRPNTKTKQLINDYCRSLGILVTWQVYSNSESK